MVVKHKKGYLLDCEKTEIDNLIKTLNLYKLRSKLEILNLSNEFIVATISFDKYLSLETNQEPGYTIKYREDTVLLDPRNINLGARLISNLEKLHLSLKKLDLKIVDTNIYYKKSYKLGIAQKNNSKLKDKIFGVECNFEELNAIDFKKGCFVGQENTSRIRLRNKLRRRLLPLKVKEGNILEGDLIKFNNKEVGRILIPDPFPFAIIKVTDPNINEFLNKELLCGSAKVEVIKPEWLKL
jgi:folate-binding protein YgfZ